MAGNLGLRATKISQDAVILARASERREYPRFGTLKRIEDITYDYIRKEQLCASYREQEAATNTKK